MRLSIEESDDALEVEGSQPVDAVLSYIIGFMEMY